jgi:serine/threonine protein kinase
MLEIDGYHIFAELKRGPVTTIYKALDTRHGRIVLIKLLHAEAAAETNRLIQFLRESNINALMVHPNLRHIYQSGAVGDAPFLALEYVEGPTLSELIKKSKKLPIDICLFIAKELAGAIAAVHRYNVLHLDIKPHNIFISYTGNVKLGDLGFARDLVDTSQLIAGTPAYMSPEQVLGLEITKASDLFSFGAVFYEMLTGEAAFANQTLSATLHHVANWDPVPITRLRPEVPVEFVATCQKLLAKNPAERYRDAEAVIEQLTRLELLYGLTTSSHDLADFIAAPETYRQVTLEQNMTFPAAGADVKYYNPQGLSWGVVAVVSATMFLAGVLYIWGVKTYVQIQPGTGERKSVSAAPWQDSSRMGFFDLQVNPAAASGVVYVDGDSLGLTPLAAPIALPPGRHEISISHPQWGERRISVDIVAGQTIRQIIDLTEGVR